MELHFELESKCLLKCCHCSSNASFAGKAFDYTIEELMEFLESITEKKLIFFTGGEPLLNQKFLDILNMVNKRITNVTVGIFSSGIINVNGGLHEVSSEYAQILAAAGLSICYFSIYSSDAKQHDWMTQVQGSYNITKESIKNLKNAGIEIRFNTPIIRLNKEHINNIIQTACQWGAKEVRLLKLIKHGRAELYWEEIGIDEEEYRTIVKSILAKKNSVRITASGVIDILACRPVENATGCQAGSQLLYVTYDGNIYPCASVKNNPEYYIGSIREKQMWKNCLRAENFCRKHALCSEDK